MAAMRINSISLNTSATSIKPNLIISPSSETCKGPKLRVGEIENNALEVKTGDILTFTNEKCIGNLEKIYVSYPNLAGDVMLGNIIMIDDGKIEVKVSSIEKLTAM
jgi:pyruvate kinase